MQTIAMKLISGEELIGRLCTSDTELRQITISHVRTLGLQQTRDGDYGVGMMDYILSNKDCEIAINEASIITMFEPAHEVEKAYLQNTSNIQLA